MVGDGWWRSGRDETEENDEVGSDEGRQVARSQEGWLFGGV